MLHNVLNAIELQKSRMVNFSKSSNATNYYTAYIEALSWVISLIKNDKKDDVGDCDKEVLWVSGDDVD